MIFKKNCYQFGIESDECFEIYDATGELLLIKNAGLPLSPVTNKAVIWGAPKVEVSKRGATDVIHLLLESNHLYDNPRITLELKDDYIEIFFAASVKKRQALNKWHILEKGSELNVTDVTDFRSHIDGPYAYLTHYSVLARRKLGVSGVDVSTEDSDRMFAPHPMLFTFDMLDTSFILAPMSLVNGQSLHLKLFSGTTTVEDYHIEIGQNVYWLEAGEKLESPHYMFTVEKNAPVYGIMSKYTRLLVRDGLIKPKTAAEMHDWWWSPMWCSFGDQHVLRDGSGPIKLADTPALRTRATHNLNEEMFRKVVDVIKKHDLPIRTLILDSRWYTKQGDMKVDTAKFPHLREDIDQLHKEGFKVICWASLYQFEKGSEIYQKHPEWFLVHHYPHNLLHNPDRDLVNFDFSDEAACQQYLGELMHRLLSDNPGCYNFDGIKFDWPFLLPHNYAFENRDWVGKEKTIYNTQKAVYQAAKRAKSDALIIGVSPHPFFQDTQDVIRTYDVGAFDIRMHLDRAHLIKSIAPGMVPCLDEHIYYRNFFAYMIEACKRGIPMIYNLLAFNGDGHFYTDDDYRKLKVILDEYVSNTPRFAARLTGRSRGEGDTKP